MSANTQSAGGCKGCAALHGQLVAAEAQLDAANALLQQWLDWYQGVADMPKRATEEYLKENQ